MELIQSFIYTVGRARLSLYEQRILLKVIEHAQIVLKGKLVKNMLFRVDHDLNNVKIDLPVRYILSDGSKHYDDVRKAALSLMERTMQFYDVNTKGWYACPLIYNVSYVQGSGLLSFYVSKMLFDVALDFSKGFCKIDLEQALSLQSPFAVRMYALLNSQHHPVTFAILDLKKMFGVEDKYKQTRDFILKVIEPAKAALDNSRCNSFAFVRNYQGNKVVSLTFTPLRRQSYSVNELAAQLSVNQLVDKEIMVVLIACFKFTTKELAAHKVLLHDFCKLPFCRDAIYNIERRVRKKGFGKGYVIAAIRDEVQRFKDMQRQHPAK